MPPKQLIQPSVLQLPAQAKALLYLLQDLEGNQVKKKKKAFHKTHEKHPEGRGSVALYDITRRRSPRSLISEKVKQAKERNGNFPLKVSHFPF